MCFTGQSRPLFFFNFIIGCNDNIRKGAAKKDAESSKHNRGTQKHAEVEFRRKEKQNTILPKKSLKIPYIKGKNRLWQRRIAQVCENGPVHKYAAETMFAFSFFVFPVCAFFNSPE